MNMRSPFWVGYFLDHIKSVRHRENFLKKANYEEANKRRLADGSSPRKKLRQSLLSFASKNPSSKKGIDRVLAGMRPCAASNGLLGNNVQICTVDAPPLKYATSL